MIGRCLVTQTFRYAFIASFVVALLSSRAAFAQVNAERFRDPKSQPGVGGAVEGSIVVDTGNTQGINAGAAGVLRWLDDPHLVLLFAKGEYSRFNNETNVSRALAHLRYNYRLASWLWGEAFVQTQRDGFQRLLRRDVFGTGPRFGLLQLPTFRVYLGTAYMFEREDIAVEVGTPDSPTTRANRWSNYLSVLWLFDERFSITGTSYIQPRFDRFSDYRWLSEAGLVVNIWRGFSTKLDVSIRYDSEPPTNVKRLDTEIKNAFEWKF